jgi:hypothetical protein
LPAPWFSGSMIFKDSANLYFPRRIAECDRRSYRYPE